MVVTTSIWRWTSNPKGIAGGSKLTRLHVLRELGIDTPNCPACQFNRHSNRSRADIAYAARGALRSDGSPVRYNELKQGSMYPATQTVLCVGQSCFSDEQGPR